LTYTELADFISFQKYLTIALQISTAGFVVDLWRDFFLSLPEATYLLDSITIMQRAMRGLVKNPCYSVEMIHECNIFITHWYWKMRRVDEGPFNEACRGSVHVVDL
jgi:hypothetical protein